MVLKWGLDRLSRPCSVQYNIDIEYFSTEISESAAAKRVEILRRWHTGVLLSAGTENGVKNALILPRFVQK